MKSTSEMYTRSPRAYAESDVLLDQLEQMPHVCKHCGQDDPEAIRVESTSGEIVIECRNEIFCARRVEAIKLQKEARATQ